MSLKDTLTVGQYCSLVLHLADEWLDGKPLDDSEVETIAWATQNQVVLRDWLMGELPQKFDGATYAIHFLNALIAQTPDNANRVGFLTCQGIIFYACDEKDLADHAITHALEFDSEYSLAKLLKRVMLAGWPAEGVQTMFGELHPKVQATIAEMSDRKIMDLIS